MILEAIFTENMSWVRPDVAHIDEIYVPDFDQIDNSLHNVENHMDVNKSDGLC